MNLGNKIDTTTGVRKKFVYCQVPVQGDNLSSIVDLSDFNIYEHTPPTNVTEGVALYGVSFKFTCAIHYKLLATDEHKVTIEVLESDELDKDKFTVVSEEYIKRVNVGFNAKGKQGEATFQGNTATPLTTEVISDITYSGEKRYLRINLKFDAIAEEQQVALICFEVSNLRNEKE